MLRFTSRDSRTVGVAGVIYEVSYTIEMPSNLTVTAIDGIGLNVFEGMFGKGLATRITKELDELLEQEASDSADLYYPC